MTQLVAVSGGVDSVVLLHMLVHAGDSELVVAHFDHGIRDDSADDARFVGKLAENYGLPFVTERAELGEAASEEAARSARYDFLRRTANEYNATIVTAHHADDVIETIAINLSRGTGWRGLAVMGDTTVERPLLATSKRFIYEYTLTHGLEWVEDSTNASDAYLRNRLRRATKQLSERDRSALLSLFTRQREITLEIDNEASRLETASRHVLTMIDPMVASELLRAWLAKQNLSLTRPQRERLLLAIKTARPGATFQAGDGVTILFEKRDFIVKHPL